MKLCEQLETLTLKTQASNLYPNEWGKVTTGGHIILGLVGSTWKHF